MSEWIDRETAATAPDWTAGGRVHNWRRYIGEKTRAFCIVAAATAPNDWGQPHVYALVLRTMEMLGYPPMEIIT